MSKYVVYDVFTDAPFGGNQLAVFPDATSLPEDQLQRITQEFNFSEVTFVYPPSDPAHTAKVRIFTPTVEIAFAGHPTIGTAVALGQLGAKSPMVLELGVGPIPCHVTGNRAEFTTSAPLTRLATPDPSLVARAINLPVSALKTDVHVPTQATLGLAFVLVELQSASDLSACRPITEAFQEGAKKHPDGLDFAIFAYVRDGNTLHARMFAPLDNMPEDPATGSASATLTALLSDIAGDPLGFTIHQGVDMGRPSLIHTQAKAGTPMPITVAGTAVQTMAGELTI